MTRNEGTFDRALRIAMGLALLTFVLVDPKAWLGLIGVVPLATGVLGYCPLYSVLGLRTS